MGIGFYIDTVGFYALLIILVALTALTDPKKRPSWIWAIPIALALVLIGTIVSSFRGETSAFDWRPWLAILALGLGVAVAMRRPKSQKNTVHYIDLVRGISIILIGSGITLTLLGTIGWTQYSLAVSSFDLRLIAVIGLFIGVWSATTGLMFWLRTNEHLSGSDDPSFGQRLGQWLVLAIIVILGLIAVVKPDSATAPLILMMVLAVEWAALTALATRQENLIWAQAKHIGFIGAAIVMLGYVQASILLLAIGSLVVAGAIHFVRREGSFCQINRREFYENEHKEPIDFNHQPRD
ncbi:MAG TPA: hypothetical protein ENM98_00490 [Halothiobacillaceae bacterium]|nr:hypothetical protein [Halothiobacillaceae bacterium]